MACLFERGENLHGILHFAFKLSQSLEIVTKLEFTQMKNEKMTFLKGDWDKLL